MENPPNFVGINPRKDGDFHGRTVSLPEGNCLKILFPSLELAGARYLSW